MKGKLAVRQLQWEWQHEQVDNPGRLQPSRGLQINSEATEDVIERAAKAATSATVL